MGNACSATIGDSHGIEGSQGTEAFTISISREEGVPLGIELDESDGYSVRLTEIDASGSFAAWNKLHHSTEQVKRGDHIVAVNGVRGTASGILQRMRQAKELEIELHRPATYTVQITKNPGGLGIETRQAQHSRSLMVSHLVGTGAVKDWNDSGQDKKVRLHDRIVKVNGCAGTVEELTEKIMAVQDGMEFCLTFTAAPPKRTERSAPVHARAVPGDVPAGEFDSLVPAIGETETGGIPASNGDKIDHPIPAVPPLK
jgi:hypothetical protein